MGKRGDRFKLRAVKQKESKAFNGPRKAAERVRREKRLMSVLQASKPPYPKIVRNWLANVLGKPEVHITAEDVKSVLARQ
ncbi:MAG TPA: hypothetical protein PKA06_10290 [Gemmatales bacterium]|nr:hypothetical protein [Gemmatales bacterium]HMP16560.1 hypothetical protein [Gemmatales bacterium]